MVGKGRKSAYSIEAFYAVFPNRMGLSEQAKKVLNIGIIGCGDVSQIVHMSTILYMSDWFRITYLCCVSSSALERCRAKIPGTSVKTIKTPRSSARPTT